MHTAGPWVHRELGSSIRVYSQSANNAEICSIAKSGFVRDANERKRADARLILAAPDLLDALRALLADIEDYERINNLAPSPGKSDCWQSVTRAKAAIAKAVPIRGT
jgi:hypothetical protein